MTEGAQTEADSHWGTLERTSEWTSAGGSSWTVLRDRCAEDAFTCTCSWWPDRSFCHRGSSALSFSFCCQWELWLEVGGESERLEEEDETYGLLWRSQRGWNDRALKSWFLSLSKSRLSQAWEWAERPTDSKTQLHRILYGCTRNYI